MAIVETPHLSPLPDKVQHKKVEKNTAPGNNTTPSKALLANPVPKLNLNKALEI